MSLNPGSDEAIEKGCTCPVYDNGHGIGFKINGKLSFWLDRDCPLHCRPPEDSVEEVNSGSGNL